ncbi:MAG: NrfD/PsrC family molybdoenzyme membrane anchor subunit [Acidobacteriota bacterium]
MGPPKGRRSRQPATPSEYAQRSFLKPPVWTWEVPLYFFIGGLAGMAAVIALAAEWSAPGSLIVEDALLLAFLGCVLSGPLLILDLGRPLRFLHMLRVFKWRSPMSVGAWTLMLFSGAVTVAWLSLALDWLAAFPSLRPLFLLALVSSAALGGVLATYTGVLLGATAVPVWARHARSLPVHFGLAGLGSAAAALRLWGHEPGLDTLLTIAAAGESLLWLGLVSLFWTSHRGGGEGAVVDRVLVRGKAGAAVQVSAALTGPASLIILLTAGGVAAAPIFLAGALLSRYAWLAVGRDSAQDAESVFVVTSSS